MILKAGFGEDPLDNNFAKILKLEILLNRKTNMTKEIQHCQQNSNSYFIHPNKNDVLLIFLINYQFHFAQEVELQQSTIPYIMFYFYFEFFV